MIQRPQTLLLFLSAILGVALMFVSLGTATSVSSSESVYLVPFTSEEISGTSGHMAAIAINFSALILAFVAVFLYMKREVQRKICIGLMVLWFILTLMMAFCPFVEDSQSIVNVTRNYSGPIIGVIGVVTSYLAARYIKKDIDLLKSADRIR